MIPADIEPMPTRRETANEYLAGMAARGFVVSEEKLAQLRQEVVDEEGTRP